MISIINSYTDYFAQSTIIPVLLLFAVLTLIPFIIAVKELLKPKDNAPLFINMNYSKDPFYFGSSFKKMLYSYIELNPLKSDKVAIKFSRDETVHIKENFNINDNKTLDRIYYIKKDLHTGKANVLSKEFYVKGLCTIQRDSVIRALYCESDIIIEDKVHTVRWINSEKNISAGTDSDLGRNCSARGTLKLSGGNKFHSLYGNPVSTGSDESSDLPREMNCTPVTEAWHMFEKNISVNITAQEKKELKHKNEPDSVRSIQKKINQWDFSGSSVKLPEESVFERNFSVSKNLEISKNSKISASVRSYGNIDIGDNVLISGNIFAEGNIKIGKNCRMAGNIFSQNKIIIGKNTQISMKGSTKSVIGKKGIDLHKGVVIFGYLLTDRKGKVL